MEVYWLEQTEADVPAQSAEALDPEWLSASELLHVHGLRFAKRRADWLLGRWTAKRAVAQCLNLLADPASLAGLEVLAANDGAPEVFRAGKPAPVTISLTHRAGLAVCAVAPAGIALGCDLEAIEPRSDAFAADYFTIDEQALVAQATPADRPRLLTLLWSAKESALKALRSGLRLDTRSVIVSAGNGPGFWHPLHVCHDSGRVFSGWWHTSGGIVRTLVADPPALPPTFLRRL